VSWLHWLAPAVGILLLGFLWAFVDRIREYPHTRHRPPIDGVVLTLLAAFGYLVWPSHGPGTRHTVLFAVDVTLLVLLVAGSTVAALGWLRVISFPARTARTARTAPSTRSRPGWIDAWYTVPELIVPSAPVVAVWTWSRPLRWCLLRPRTFLRLRRLGVRGLVGVSLVGQWFSPAQVGRLGWPGATLQLLVGAFGWRRGSDLDTSGWDADAFIRAVHASGRPWADYAAVTPWRTLFRLGVDSVDFVRYARGREPRVGIDIALRYGLADIWIPYDVFPALYHGLERGGATPPDVPPLLDHLATEAHRDLDAYRDGWAGLAAWVGYDGRAYVRSLRRAAGPALWEPEPVFARWRSWGKVAARESGPQPALWDAAGLTVDEALTMIDAGDPPDKDVLEGLAALRRETVDPGRDGA
jgi:hypothetical protein